MASAQLSHLTHGPKATRTPRPSAGEPAAKSLVEGGRRGHPRQVGSGGQVGSTVSGKF